MKCPACAHNLRKVFSHDVIVEICPSCQGIWFDTGELATFLKSLTETEEISPLTPQLFKEAKPLTTKDIKENTRACPKDQHELKKFNYAYDSNVFLDKCEHCQGVWADGDEARLLARYMKKDDRIDKLANSMVELGKKRHKYNNFVNTCEQLTSPGVLIMPKIIIPLGDFAPTSKFAFVTLSIIITNILVFVIQSLYVNDLGEFFKTYGALPQQLISTGTFTYMFVHGGIFHLIGNMFFLWIFGDNVEDEFSYPGYLLFFLSCGLFAVLIHSMFNSSSVLPVVGASGAISGVMGAYLFFHPHNSIRMFFVAKVIDVPAFLFLGIWFLMQILFGLITHAAGAHGGVAWFAHIGGFALGAAIAYFKRLES